MNEWMTEYERAFRQANGVPAKVVICGGGWYRIATAETTSERRRKADIIAMTARLEQRIAPPHSNPQVEGE
jgi:hypothetical protein